MTPAVIKPLKPRLSADNRWQRRHANALKKLAKAAQLAAEAKAIIGTPLHE